MMPRDDPAATAPIGQLQATLLSKLLLGAPLPGQTQPVHFPDLAFITEAPTVLVAAEETVGSLQLQDVGKRLEIVPETEIRERATRSGDCVFVRFHAAERIGDNVRIRMDVVMAPAEADVHSLGLGAISATFVRNPGEGESWIAAEPPSVVAF
jgi:hypothetical protein